MRFRETSLCVGISLFGESTICSDIKLNRLGSRSQRLYLGRLPLNGERLIDLPGARRARNEQETDGTEAQQRRS